MPMVATSDKVIAPSKGSESFPLSLHCSVHFSSEYGCWTNVLNCDETAGASESSVQKKFLGKILVTQGLKVIFGSWYRTLEREGTNKWARIATSRSHRPTQ
ncbi:unnamed protein product, partial [Trichogramma brassicae]